jgi:hypothetical protein
MVEPASRPRPLPTKNEIRETALNALVRVAKDKTAPPAAVAAAARTLLESIGDIGRLQELARATEKPLSEMTANEIEDEIARLQKKA